VDGIYEPCSLTVCPGQLLQGLSVRKPLDNKRSWFIHRGCFSVEEVRQQQGCTSGVLKRAINAEAVASGDENITSCIKAIAGSVRARSVRGCSVDGHACAHEYTRLGGQVHPNGRSIGKILQGNWVQHRSHVRFWGRRTAVVSGILTVARGHEECQIDS